MTAPRSAAPCYRGEGPFALWHFSEDADLERFVPRVAPAQSDRSAAVVWAVDTRHAPMYWFPRECPRGCIWPSEATNEHDRRRFFGHSTASRIHVMESEWLDRVRACRLYGYRLPAETFSPHPDTGGYWISREPVTAVERVPLTDLLRRHAAAGIELRVTPSLWPWWRSVIGSTVEFSGIRLRNSTSADSSSDHDRSTDGTVD